MGSAGGRHAAIASSADGDNALKGPLGYSDLEQLWDALRDNSRRLERLERGERRFRSNPATPEASTPLSFAGPCTPVRGRRRFESTPIEAAEQHGPSTPCGEVGSEEACLQQLFADELKSQLRNCEVKLGVVETQSARLAMAVNTSSNRIDRLQDFIVKRLGGDTETAPWLLRPEKRPKLDFGCESLDKGADVGSGVPAEQPLFHALAKSPLVLDADTGVTPRDMICQIREMQRRMQELQAFEPQVVQEGQVHCLAAASADVAHRLQELEAGHSIDDVQRLSESPASHALGLDDLKSQTLESQSLHPEQVMCFSAPSSRHNASTTQTPGQSNYLWQSSRCRRHGLQRKTSLCCSTSLSGAADPECVASDSSLAYV